MRHKWTSLKKPDKYMIFIFAFLLIFIVVMSVIFCFKGAIPDSLVDLVKVVLGFECGALGWIKTTNVKHGKDGGSNV